MGDGASWFFITVPKRSHEEELIRLEKQLIQEQTEKIMLQGNSLLTIIRPNLLYNLAAFLLHNEAFEYLSSLL